MIRPTLPDTPNYTTLRGTIVDDEADRLPFEQQLLAIPASLRRTPEFSPPAVAAEEITEQLEFFAEFAMLQRLDVVKDQKQVGWPFFKERPGLLFHEAPNVLVERG